jgi:hypothetical protein
MCSKRTLGAGVLLAMVGSTMSSCFGDVDDDDKYVEEKRRYQCAYEQGGQEIAVDCDDVNDGDGTTYVGGTYVPVFIHSSSASLSSGYAAGQRLPAGGYRIGYRDANGRALAGLPPRGPVANNTVKTGVVGKGGAPAPAGAKAGGGGGKGSGGG